MSRTLGITRFDLLGDFGRFNWLGNFYIVLCYNLLFAIMTTLCLVRKFTSAVREELLKALGLDKLHLSHNARDSETAKPSVNGHQKTLWNAVGGNEPFSFLTFLSLHCTCFLLLLTCLYLGSKLMQKKAGCVGLHSSSLDWSVLISLSTGEVSWTFLFEQTFILISASKDKILLHVNTLLKMKLEDEISENGKPLLKVLIFPVRWHSENLWEHNEAQDQYINLPIKSVCTMIVSKVTAVLSSKW